MTICVTATTRETLMQKSSVTVDLNGRPLTITNETVEFGGEWCGVDFDGYFKWPLVLEYEGRTAEFDCYVDRSIMLGNVMLEYTDIRGGINGGIKLAASDFADFADSFPGTDEQARAMYADCINHTENLARLLGDSYDEFTA